ncbi:chalcone isomerase family protein [Flammeovirga pacifica]|uniref:Chalcone isomerase domain-containing protein n=1 Tax=Flammeovirga pacifica TaxID=915059 RepID=A0A1S1YU13_FLAPC|nr:chalcone isomerase family protein [Flammeovirga pacifica]OHX64501.1 hypothetical protein NH26_23265 [Flammeovirga pacifica]
MKTKFLFIFTLFSSFLSLGQTTKVSNITLQQYINIEGRKMELNGAGVRTKYLFPVYVSSLYLQDKSSNPNEVLYNIDHKIVQVDIISSLITKEQFKESVKEGLEYFRESSDIDHEIDMFLSVIKDEVVLGDKFQFVAEDSVCKIFKNNKELIVIDGKKFQKALFSIWLGNKPIDDNLKDEMLGKI